MPYRATVNHAASIDAHARGHAFYQEALTGVRALAAVWVMLFHVNAYAGPRVLSVSPFGVRIDLHPLMTVGWLGVTIFFVLSGFLLTTHLLDAFERRDERVLPRYFAARIRRVIPAFWAQLAILFVVAFAIRQAPPPWTPYIPLHLLMLHNVSETASYAINSVYWTLPIEFAFYLVLPIIAVRLARLDAAGASPWKTLVLLYAAALGVSIAYRYAAYPLGGTNIAWISNQLPGTIDQFVLGTVLAAQWRWWRKSGEAQARAARMSDALTIAGLAGMVAMIYYLDHIYETFWVGHPAVYVWYSINAFFAGMVVMGAAMGGRIARWIFGNPIAIFLGTISYSLYLWHYPIVEWLRPLDLGYATFFAVAIPLCIAVLGRRDHFVGARERVRSRDVEDVHVGPDVLRERLERRRESHDALGGAIEELVARGAVHLDRFDFPVLPDADRELQRGIDAARLRLVGIVERADAFHLRAPAVDVGREAVFLGARADELLARPLLVGLVLAADLRLQPLDLEVALDDVAGLLRLLGRRDRDLGLELQHELARLGLELLHAFLGRLDLGAGLARVDRRRKRRRGAQLPVGVAAALEVRLREGVRLLRLRSALRVDQDDVEDVVGCIEPADAWQVEAHADDHHHVEADGGDDRHLHGGDEPELFEQEIRERDEGVGRRLP